MMNRIKKAMENLWEFITASTIWIILTSKWFWIIVSLTLFGVLTPLIFILSLLYIPFPYNSLVIILLVICWGIVAGYKDWIISKKREEERRR